MCKFIILCRLLHRWWSLASMVGARGPLRSGNWSHFAMLIYSLHCASSPLTFAPTLIKHTSLIHAHSLATAHVPALSLQQTLSPNTDTMARCSSALIACLVSCLLMCSAYAGTYEVLQQTSRSLCSEVVIIETVGGHHLSLAGSKATAAFRCINQLSVTQQQHPPQASPLAFCF